MLYYITNLISKIMSEVIKKILAIKEKQRDFAKEFLQGFQKLYQETNKVNGDRGIFGTGHQLNYNIVCNDLKKFSEGYDIEFSSNYHKVIEQTLLAMSNSKWSMVINDPNNLSESEKENIEKNTNLVNQIESFIKDEKVGLKGLFNSGLFPRNISLPSNYKIKEIIEIKDQHRSAAKNFSEGFEELYNEMKNTKISDRICGDLQSSDRDLFNHIQQSLKSFAEGEQFKYGDNLLIAISHTLDKMKDNVKMYVTGYPKTELEQIDSNAVNEFHKKLNEFANDSEKGGKALVDSGICDIKTRFSFSKN